MNSMVILLPQYCLASNIMTILLNQMTKKSLKNVLVSIRKKLKLANNNIVIKWHIICDENCTISNSFKYWADFPKANWTLAIKLTKNYFHVKKRHGSQNQHKNVGNEKGPATILKKEEIFYILKEIFFKQIFILKIINLTKTRVVCIKW